jgi:hypothetical protein
MIIVRNTFICKPGNASKLAAQFKAATAGAPDMKARILTDATGDFNKVVMEFEAADFGEFQKRMAEYQSDTDFRKKMEGYTDLYLTGTRELFNVVE